MRIAIIFLVLTLNSACAAYSENNESRNSNKKIKYNENIHRPGTPEDWQKTENLIKYNHVRKLNDLFEIPVNRTPGVQAKNVLYSLHTWFSEGAGYTTKQYYPYEILVLNELPKKVLSEILTLTKSPQTGFSILDKHFWSNVDDLQRKGLSVGFISHTPQLIAGLYVSKKNLVAIDVYANSGTLTHELAHHSDYKLLKPRGWFDFNEEVLDANCKSDLAVFMGELSATTSQLKDWVRIIKDHEFITYSLEEFNRTGGSLYGDNLPEAFAANLAYPTERGNAFLQNSTCPDSINNTVHEIRRLVSKQESYVLPEKEVINFSLIYKNNSAKSLEKIDSSCIDGKSSVDCTNEVKIYEDYVSQIAKAKSDLVDRINLAWQERLTKIPSILDQIDSDYQKELCDEVLGYQTMANCNENLKHEERK